MHLLQGFFRILTAFISTGVLAISVLGFNGLQTLSLLILPFSRKAFRHFNRWCAGAWWSLAVFTAEKILGFEIVISGDELPVAENAIVIANHQEMPDILVVLSLAFRKGRICDLKWFAKDVIKYVPGIGWGMFFIDCIFLKRNWLDDRSSVFRTFAKYHSEEIPFWLVSFPEGTRIRPSKFAKSAEFRSKANLPPLRFLLSPRTKGFAASVAGLREDAAAVYDLTIGFEGGVPSLRALLTGPKRVHLHVRRFAMASLPNEESAIGDWLQMRFLEKDQLLSDYFTTGHFPG